MTEYKFKIIRLKQDIIIDADLTGRIIISVAGWFQTLKGKSLFYAKARKDKEFHELTRNYYLNRDFMKIILQVEDYPELQKFLIETVKGNAVNVSVCKSSDVDYFEKFRVLEGN